jgi:3-hydroxyisobutyrate dehydrogenase-like beta-hydroxyacid dehydrogenase
MSTIDPLVARRLGGELAARGVAMLDAPVDASLGLWLCLATAAPAG